MAETDSPGPGVSVPPLESGGLMILQRDFVDDFLIKFFGEEMGGGQGDPDPLVNFLGNLLGNFLGKLSKIFLVSCFPFFL